MSNTPSPQAHAELREKATKATPGPWRVRKHGLDDGNIAIDGPTPVYSTWDFTLAKVGSRIAPKVNEDAAFIAAANPATVLALLDRIAALEAQVAEAREIIQGRLSPNTTAVDAVQRIEKARDWLAKATAQGAATKRVRLAKRGK